MPEQLDLLDVAPDVVEEKQVELTPIIEDTQLESMIELAFVLFADGIRRWRDLDIGNWAQYGRQRSIRKLIKENREELERHGSLLLVEANPGPEGGRPAKEYWLNFRQAMVLCTLLRTQRAEDVRFIMILVFDRVVNGDLATAPRMDQRAFAVEAGQVVISFLTPILTKLDDRLINIEEAQAKIGTVIGEIYGVGTEIRSAVKTKRADVTDELKNEIIDVTQTYFDGRCPISGVPICENGKKLPNAEFDHFNGRENRDRFDVWLVDRTAHDRLSDPEFKDTTGRKRHEEFNAAWRVYLRLKDSQTKLSFGTA